MHHEYIRNLILRLCKQPRTFEFISKNVSGLEPTETKQFLETLESESIIQLIDDFWVIKEVSISPTLNFYKEETKHYLQQYMGYYDFLKTPHPLDFEWRNSTKSLNDLITRASGLVGRTEKILFLGMPTLFAMAIERDIPQTVTLVERNEPIIEGLHTLRQEKKRFRIIKDDIFKIDVSKVGKHSLVIMDPPWYTPHFKQFMWLAANSVDVGGTVAISIPPINTRPNIIKERIEWLSYCEQLGLCIELLQPNQLQYSMPFFEFNAFRAAGVAGILPFWRSGDFAIFKKLRAPFVERPVSDVANDSWIEVSFDGTRIRIKKETEITESSLLVIESIVKGDILPTISSRDQRRNGVNIWTSGNRIFKTNNPCRFVELVKQYKIGKMNMPECDDQKTVYRFLDHVLDLENKEFKEYIDWLYYEMERETTH